MGIASANGVNEPSETRHIASLSPCYTYNTHQLFAGPVGIILFGGIRDE